MDDDSKEYAAITGVSQSFVHEPLLLKIIFEGLLGLRVLKKTTAISFADYLAVMEVAKRLEDVEI